MKLRRCPNCKDLVGAESTECPRCGVSFRAALVRKIVLWTALVLAVAWTVSHFVFHLA
jgi:RNA polymerase subunit RPABC4/transcription elongation factor Spt4